MDDNRSSLPPDDRHLEQRNLSNAALLELLQATIDSSLDMIQVFKAVRNEHGEIIDFIWILNNKTSEKFYGKIIGKSLLTLNPGVVTEGIFDTFKKVVETGEPDQSVRHYVHEQFDGWFLQSAVKQSDGLTTTTKDISDVKKAEQEQQKSRALLQSIIDAPNIGIAVFKAVRDDRGQIVDFLHEYINRASKVMLGEDWTGRLFTEHGENALQQMPQFLEVMATGKSRNYVREADFQGSKIWFAITNTFLDGDRLVHTWEDVTERKIDEEQLRTAKELVQTVFDVTINPIAYHKAVRDNADQIIDFEFQLENKKAREYTLGDRTGQRHSEAYPGIKDTIVFEKYCEVVETGHTLDTEVEINLKGRNLWFHLMAARLGDGLVATAIDITQRKNAEAEILKLKDEIAQQIEDKYRVISDSIKEGLCIYELIYDEDQRPVDLRWIEVNSTYEEQTGLKDVIGKRHSDLSMYTERYWLETYDRVLRTGEPVHLEEWHQPTQRWYNTFTSRDGGPESKRVIVLFSNITERKHHEKNQQYLLTFSDAMRAEGSADTIAQRSLELLSDYLQLDRCYIALYNVDENKADILFQVGNETVPPMPEKIRLTDFPEALKIAFETTLIIEDFDKTEKLSDTDRQNIGALGLRALVAATLRKDENRPLWCIAAVSSQPRHWTKSDISIIEEVTERTWTAIERAKAEEALRESELRLAQDLADAKLLQQFSNEVIHLDELNEIYEMLLDTSINLMQSDIASIQLYSEQTQTLSLVAHKNFHPESASFWSNVSAGSGSVCGEALVHKSRILVEDVEIEEFAKSELEIFRLSGIRAVQSSPIRSRKGKLIGMLNTQWKQPRSFSEDEFRFFDVLVRQAADFIERKQAENASRESEKRFQSVANLVPDLLWDSEPDGSTNWYNQRWLEYTGQSIEQAIGWGWVDAIHPNDREGSAKRYNRAVAAAEPLQQEHRIRRHDGQYRWFVVYASPLKDENGSVVKMYGSATDIHDIKQAEEVLRQSEEKYRSLFENIDEGFALMELHRDAEGVVIDMTYREVNEAFKRYTGWHNAAGQRGSQLMPSLEPYLLTIMQLVADTGQPYRQEDHVADLNKWYDVHYSCVHEPGTNFIVAVFKDTTDRRQNEERQKLLLVISDKLNAADNLKDVQTAVTNSLLEYYDAGWCYYVEWDEEKNAGVVEYDSKRDELLSLAGVHDVSDIPEYLELLKSGQILNVSNYQDYELLSPRIREQYTTAGFRSMLVASLIRQDRLISSLIIGDTKTRNWTFEDETLINEIAERTWAAVERARVQVSLETELKRTMLLHNLSSRLITEENLMAAYEEILSTTITITEAAAGTLQIFDPAAEELVLLVTIGIEQQMIDHFRRVDAGSTTACGIALRTGKRTFVDFDKGEIDQDRRMHIEAGLLSAQATPLLARDGTPIGMLNTHWQESGHRPDADQLRFLDLLARHIADLFEQRRAQGRLLRSEEQFRTLSDAVPQVIWTNTPEGEADYFNKRWYEYSGLSYEESNGPGWQAIVYPDDAPASQNRWLKALAEGVVFDAEYRLRRSDGVYRWFIGRNVPLKDDSGKVIKWFGSATDIHDLKIAEEALQESRERLRVTMESAVEYAIITTDEDGLIEGWNKGAQYIFGYLEEEVLGKSATLIFTTEDRAAGVPQKEMEKARREGRAEDDRWHVRKDGTLFYMGGVTSPIYDSQLTGYVKVARDMTGSKAAEERLRVSEERYRVALKSADMAAWDWNITDDTIQWNDQHFLLLGLQPEEGLQKAENFLQFVHPDDLATVGRELLEAVDKTGNYRVEAFRIIRADGKVRWMTGFGRTVAWKDGKSTRMVGVMFDITKRKELEQHKEQFIGIASHELRTPVTSIKVYTEMLEELFAEKGDLYSAGLMQKMDVQVDRLTSLIYALLDSTLVTEGKLQLQKTYFDIDALIMDTVETLDRISGSHKIEMELGVNAVIFADQERVRQVITNLITNAIKYAPGTDRVIVRSQSDSKGITVQVQDFGIGMDEETQQQLFEPYFRSPNAGSFSGLGLGLFISSGIVRQHKGTISVNSKKGEGAVFTFTIPFV